jgi:hypothetical protein
MNTCFLNHFRGFAARAAVVLALVTLLVPASLTAQQGFASLEEQMTGEEYRAAGLDKLSPQELDSLNAWIRSRSLATLDAPRYGSSQAGASASMGGDDDRPDIEEMERKRIMTRIDGSFTGWDGQTVFKLENGMIWVQADGDKFHIKELQNPAVTIEPNFFGGGWMLSVEGYKDDCKVKRIQ